MLRRIKVTLSTMASTQPSTESLVDVTPPAKQEFAELPADVKPEEYCETFREAYLHHMPRYDFRVWDRCLYSRCSTQDRLFGILKLY